MGGLAFTSGDSPLHTPRMPPHVYQAVKEQCQKSLLGLYENVASPIEGPGKSDYGDVDIFVWQDKASVKSKGQDDETTRRETTLPSPANQVPEIAIQAALGAEFVIIETGGSHFAVPWPADLDHVPPTATDQPKRYIQVDVTILHSDEQFRWSLFRHAHGDLWSILGSVIRPFGLTVDEHALHLRISEIEKLNRNKAKVLLTRDPSEVLDFLGLPTDEYWAGPFASLDVMYEYAARCRMFWVAPATQEQPDEDGRGTSGMEGDKTKLKSNDRRRMNYRPAFRLWVEDFLPRCRLQGRFSEEPTSRDQVLREALDRFQVGVEYQQRLDEHRRETQATHIWNHLIKAAFPASAVYSPNVPEYRGCLIKALKKIVLEGDESYGVMPDPELPLKDDGGVIKMSDLQLWLAITRRVDCASWRAALGMRRTILSMASRADTDQNSISQHTTLLLDLGPTVICHKKKISCRAWICMYSSFGPSRHYLSQQTKATAFAHHSNDLPLDFACLSLGCLFTEEKFSLITSKGTPFSLHRLFAIPFRSTLSRTSDDSAVGTMSTSSTRRKVARPDLNTPIATCYPEGITYLLDLPGKVSGRLLIPFIPQNDDDNDLKPREPFFRVEVGGRYFNVPSGLLRDYPYWSSLLFGNWKESVTDTRVIEGIPAEVFGLALEIVVRRGLFHDDELAKMDLPTLFAVIRVFDRFAMDRLIGTTLGIVNQSLDIRWYAEETPDFTASGKAKHDTPLAMSVRRAAEINNAFEIGRPVAYLVQYITGKFFASHFLLNIPREHYDATLPKMSHELLVEINKLLADVGGSVMLHQAWKTMRASATAPTVSKYLRDVCYSSALCRASFSVEILVRPLVFSPSSPSSLGEPLFSPLTTISRWLVFGFYCLFFHTPLPDHTRDGTQQQWHCIKQRDTADDNPQHLTTTSSEFPNST
ncbi:hypothetical protein ACRALDRAFT_1092608 [Sodiomyces alcalophilus JCM 7366]|uniref:uncharacterized protein n=1 Tax=Sodiomyces alcalophilus JCM 7366 TaxID=591952 RepID=UPI0039B469A1